MARSLIALVLVAGTAMLAAACGSSEEGPVRFLVFGDPEEIQAYRQVVADFEEESGDDVELVEASDRSDLIARLSTSIAAGTPPDVFLMNYRYYAQFAARDAIEPVTERFDESDAFEPEDFYPIALNAFRWRGEQLCIPQNISSLVVYYNRDLFQKYGVPEPEDDWTWNTMVGHAGALTRDANGQQIRPGDPDSGGATAAVYGLGVEPSIIRVAPFVWSNGGELVDDDANPTRFTLDTPEAQEALRGFLDLRLAYGVIPSDVEVEASGRRDALCQRRAGDAPLLAPLDAPVPHDHRVRLGHRPAAALDAAGRDPPLGCVLHHRRVRAQEHGVGLRRVRPGA